MLVLLLETRRSSRLAEQRGKAASGNEKTAVTSSLGRRGIHEDRLPAGAPPPPPPPPPLPTFQSGSARSVLPLKDRNVNAIDKVRQVSTVHILATFKGDMQRYLTKLTESYFQLLTTIQRRLCNRF